MKKISAVYKIVNTVTGDFYVGSSKDVKLRWSSHREPSRWNRASSSRSKEIFDRKLIIKEK